MDCELEKLNKIRTNGTIAPEVNEMVKKMVKIKMECIHCGSEEIVKMGYQKSGTPRCKCKDCGRTFQTKYTNKGATPETKRLIIEMSANGCGIRHIARDLGISKDTVMTTLKKRIKSQMSIQ